MKLLAVALAVLLFWRCAIMLTNRLLLLGQLALRPKAALHAAENNTKALTKQKVPRKLLTNPLTLPKTATILLSSNHGSLKGTYLYGTGPADGPCQRVETENDYTFTMVGRR